MNSHLNVKFIPVNTSRRSCSSFPYTETIKIKTFPNVASGKELGKKKSVIKFQCLKVYER